MTRKWCTGTLAFSGLLLALGCRTTEPAPFVTTHATAVPTITMPNQIATSNVVPVSGVPKGELKPRSQPVPSLAPVRPDPSLTAKEGPILVPILPPRDTIPLMPLPKPVDSIVKPIPTTVAKNDRFVSTSIAGSASPSPVVITPPVPDRPKAIGSLLSPGQKFGHGADYRWVAGVLDRHQRAGYWTIRYSDVSADDKWGGKVRVLDDVRLRDFQSGDVVYVEGEILAPSSAATGALAYPPFRVTDIKLIEKGK